LTIDIGDATGVLEFDWIRVTRKAGGRTAKVAQWDFA
jgi:hypothetical protein